MKKDISFGKYYAYWMNNSPKRFLYHLMYYKFAAKLIGKNKKVLDVGCNEGIGTRLLSIECGHASGIDLDLYAIKTAKKNWSDNQTTFNCMNFFDYKGEGWDALTSFDVVEHIQKKNIKKWWACIKKKLKHDGIALIGTPSLSSKKYASKITQKGHINLYSDLKKK